MPVALPVAGFAVMTIALSRAPPVAGSNLRRHAGEEAAERGLDGDADDRIVRSGHADVGDVRRAFRQDALVGGLHVRVGAEDRRDAAVEMPAHRQFLGVASA